MRWFVNVPLTIGYNAGMKRNNAREWAGVLLFFGGIAAGFWAQAYLVAVCMVLAGIGVFNMNNTHIHPDDV